MSTNFFATVENHATMTVMNASVIRKWAESIPKKHEGDDERAHISEVVLWQAALESIARSAPNPWSKMAKAALETKKMAISRFGGKRSELDSVCA